MMDPDPFTAELDLEPFRPFAYSHDAAVHFQDPRGTHWLVLDSIYTGQQGVTVHVVRPADLTPLDGVGGGMDNWANYLVKAIRERDASAMALFSYWPDNPYDVIRHVVFTRAEEVSIQDESALITAANSAITASTTFLTCLARPCRRKPLPRLPHVLTGCQIGASSIRRFVGPTA